MLKNQVPSKSKDADVAFCYGSLEEVIPEGVHNGHSELPLPGEDSLETQVRVFAHRGAGFRPPSHHIPLHVFTEQPAPPASSSFLCKGGDSPRFSIVRNRPTHRVAPPGIRQAGIYPYGRNGDVVRVLRPQHSDSELLSGRDSVLLSRHIRI